MKRFHIALSVKDLKASIRDYSRRLGREPSVVVPGKYALWRTSSLNFSIRVTRSAGKLRHIGWEDPQAALFSKSTDVNGIVWEHFNEKQQRAEIETI